MAELPQIDGYRITGELGAGSVSVVYKAVSESLGRTVALKVLRGTVSAKSSFASQLEREALLLSQLSHPGIALLYDFVKTPSRMHLVLEYVDGFSVSAILGKRSLCRPDVVAAVGVEVARALSYAHARGIVHRDIKPSTILISRLGEVKLVDFGLALSPTDSEPSLSGGTHRESSSFGSPSYMSPERLLGEKMEPRSDLFSVGVILYELLTGMRPYERGGETDRRSQNVRLRREPAVPLHKRAPHVPRALERVIMQALDRNPNNRPESAASFADELERSVTFPEEARSQTIGRILDLAGLTESPARDTLPKASVLASEKPTRVLLGFLGSLAALVVGGTIIQWTAPGDAHPLVLGPLELVPPEAGALRVLASPWAEVQIDGQAIDTTPMARSVPLAAGTHYVTLSHPAAAKEQRVVKIVAGETQTLDVVMSIDAGPPREVAAEKPAVKRAPP